MNKPLCNENFLTASEWIGWMEVMRFILSNKNFGAEAVMHHFSSRYDPLIASTLLHQLHLYAKGEVYREVENQKELDEFYSALNELLVAVYFFCEKLKAEKASMDKEESVNI